MAGRSGLAERVYAAVQGPVESLGIDLVDVELVREGSSRILRLIIDKPGGVDHEDCSAVSRLADPLIDRELGISVHDYLEVSSPGLDRPLKTDRDLARHRGEWVEVSLYQPLQGKKKHQGILGPCTGQQVQLELEQGETLDIQRSQVAKIKRVVRF